MIKVFSIEGESSAVRFILQRQDFPRPDCWLTEGVQFIEEEPVRLRRNSEKELHRKVERKENHVTPVSNACRRVDRSRRCR